MKYNSRAFFAGERHLPVEFTNERVYMEPIQLWERLPASLARWEPLVHSLTAQCGIKTGMTAYLMIDQMVADERGVTRRPGWHIDGYWDPGMGGHSPKPPAHKSGAPSWAEATFDQPEGIVLWSDVGGLMAWNGEFEGPVGEGGDCSRVELRGGNSIIQGDNQIICGNVTMMHESLEVVPGTRRTVVRMSVPGWSP